jgi:hypothetical protein
LHVELRGVGAAALELYHDVGPGARLNPQLTDEVVDGD